MIHTLAETFFMGILLVFAAAVLTALPGLSATTDAEKTQFEAAFQGRCGHESPCEQLCYELHDGMFECDCKQGFTLHQDGYSCTETNRTVDQPGEEEEEGEDVLYEKEAWFSAELATAPATLRPNSKVVTQTEPTQICALDCGSGTCVPPDLPDPPRCQCPLGRAPPDCRNEMIVESPRFTGEGWLAFPALKAAYKNVQLEIEFRPEASNGIIFLTGERDDLAGDFMALLIYQGFIEFRFDCGSGVGVVRSDETVVLNQWNKITLYRHKWDAWIQLNGGSRLQGRSKGLFSRMTFREPVFIGGRGNTSGLQGKLPTEQGFRGCVSHLQINDHIYNFAPSPKGEAVQGYDIEECIADSCSKIMCQHGGKCLMSAELATCLCPLGYTGELCETRLDLQIPSFNGTSYLRYPALSNKALSWLEIFLVVKPETTDGLILYNGQRPDGVGDFVALTITHGHFEFAFDLGTGSAVVRAHEAARLNEWHEVLVSRTGRLAVLQINKNPSAEILSPGAFTQLYLPLDMYVGGVPDFEMVSSKVKARTNFVGCIQKFLINEKPVEILGQALAGINIDNCPHPCSARPCGDFAQCVPKNDEFKCVCERHCDQANFISSSSTVASFTYNTFLHYTDPEIISRLLTDRMSINIRLKTTVGTGLILWTALTDANTQSTTDFFALAIRNGYLHLRYNLGSGEAFLIYNLTRVDDGNWHRIKATRNRQEGTLTVDNGSVFTVRSPGKLKQLNANTGLSIGGMENMAVVTRYKYQKGFHGCVSELTLNSDYHIKLAWTNQSSNICGTLPP